MPYDALVQIKMPRAFAADIERAAQRRFMSRSDFVRSVLADRLKADRVEALEVIAR